MTFVNKHKVEIFKFWTVTCNDDMMHSVVIISKTKKAAVKT